MNKFLIAALAAATALPSAAMAQPPDHRAYSRPDVHAAIVVDNHARPGTPGWYHPAKVQRIAVGARVDRDFVARYAVIQHPARYHLARANANMRWLKVRDDAVLVNLRTGRVVDIRHSIFR